MHRKGVDKEVLAALELLTNDNQMIRSLSLYSAGESNSDCKIENLEY